MKAENARVHLLEVKEILDALNIKFWLYAGTLLGAMREKNFIPFDLDVDLTILAKDWNPLLKERFAKGSFWYADLRHRQYPAHLQRFALKKWDVKTDVFLHYYYSPDDVYMLFSLHPFNRPITIAPARYYRGDCFIDFLGASFRVPNPPEQWLEETYGKNWRTPDEAFEWKKVLPRIHLEKYLVWFRNHPKEEWIK